VMTSSYSSHWKPNTESRPLYAGHRLHSIRIRLQANPKSQGSPWFWCLISE
jgi:hypothetical protein